MKQHVDLAIKNAFIYNSFLKKFIKGTLTILDNKIYHIIKDPNEEFRANEVIDACGKYIIPGLIDIHMHIESSMITPLAFCEEAIKRGTTTLISEPHEMANVSGIHGVKAMIEEGNKSPLDVYYGIPSSVPSTNSTLETSGAIITSDEMEELYELDSVKCVGEIMNYSEIIRENDLTITKFIKKLRKSDKIFPIEGHCPSLLDEDLSRFLYLGINGDHTEHSIEELYQRFESGMFVEIQMKLLRKEVIDLIRDNNFYEHFGFVTDDIMVDTLVYDGQLNNVLLKAISLGESAENVIYNATYTNSKRMNLLDRGYIAPGMKADVVILNNLNTFDVDKTLISGKVVYEKGIDLNFGCDVFDESYYHSIKIRSLKKDDISIVPPISNGSVKVRVMIVSDGSTKTQEEIREVNVVDNELLYREAGLMLIAVFNRYEKDCIKYSYGLVSGDCIKEGAVATTYSHDSHNLCVVSDNIENLLLVCNRVIELQGGIVTAFNNTITSELQLNINGILSDQKAPIVASKLTKVIDQLRILGYKHYSPIMSLCTLCLPVSPSLKISDKGLIDVREGKIVPLYIE
jgi:adenine deaminase